MNITENTKKVIERERRETLEELSKLSLDEITLLKYKKQIEARERKLKRKIEAERERKMVAFFSLTLIALIGGGLSVLFFPQEVLLKGIAKYPHAINFMIGFAIFGIFSRLIFTYHITYTALKLVLKKVDKHPIGERDIKLIKKFFIGADAEDPEAEALTSTEIAEHVFRKTKQKLNAKSIGRKLKKTFPRRGNRRYIVKEIDDND